MNYTSSIRKLLAGETLNALERAELENFDADALCSERDTALAERDQARGEQQQLQREKQLSAIAGKYQCREVDFLDFLARKNNLDLSDEPACEKFMAQMLRDNPRCFHARIQPGTGEIPASAGNTVVSAAEPLDRISRIAASLDAAESR